MVQSNNATYGGTGQIEQQFAITRARAMEVRREIAVATTNSVSGFIDRDGRVVGAPQSSPPHSFGIADAAAQCPHPGVAGGSVAGARAGRWLAAGLSRVALVWCDPASPRKASALNERQRAKQSIQKEIPVEPTDARHGPASDGR